MASLMHCNEGKLCTYKISGESIQCDFELVGACEFQTSDFTLFVSI